MFEEPTHFEAAEQPFDGSGRFRRFGEAGPVYEVLNVDGQNVRVRLVDGDEELDYRLSDALRDPVA